MRRLFVLFSWLLVMSAAAQTNLLLNGGFETYRTGSYASHPTHWQVANILAPQREKTQVKEGQSALKVYPNGARLSATDAQSSLAAVAITPGRKYRLSFWYAGTLTRRNVVVSFGWYKAGKLIKTTTLDNSVTDKVQPTTQWQQKTHEVQAPEGVTHMGVAFVIERESGDRTIFLLLDDVQLIDAGAGSDHLPPPTQVVATPYQHEATLSWDREGTPGMRWEILDAKGQLVGTTQQEGQSRPQFTIDGLLPATRYVYGLRSLAPDGRRSEVVSLTLMTAAKRAESDAQRMPLLRTVPHDGFVKRAQPTLRTYFTDLYAHGAQLSYYLDGHRITPQGTLLTLTPPTDQLDHQLTVVVREASGREWTLDYFLTFE